MSFTMRGIHKYRDRIMSVPFHRSLTKTEKKEGLTHEDIRYSMVIALAHLTELGRALECKANLLPLDELQMARFSNVAWLCSNMRRASNEADKANAHAVTEFCVEARLAAAEAIAGISAEGLRRYLRIHRTCFVDRPGTATSAISNRDAIAEKWTDLLKLVNPGYVDAIRPLFDHGVSHSDSYEWIQHVR